MIQLVQSSAAAQSFLIAGCAVSAIIATWLCFVRCKRLQRPEPVSLIAAVILVVLLYMLMTVHLFVPMNRPPEGLFFAAGRIPIGFYTLFLVVTALVCGGVLWKEVQLYRKTITSGTIREAIDDLPGGLCFSEPDGLPVLVNRRMYAFSLELTGKPLQNCEEFWHSLSADSECDIGQPIEDGGHPVFSCSDGKIWRFSRKVLEIDGRSYIQMTASDVTRQHQLSRALRENNAALDQQKERLKELLANIVQLKHEEEVLASKIRIHGQFGQCVLTTRRALVQNRPPEEMEEVTALWRNVIRKMRLNLSELQEDEDDTLNQLKEAAAAMGCKLVFTDVFPTDRDTKYLLLTAVREAVTNAVRHAGADQVTVTTTKTEDAYVTVICDNGLKKVQSVSEGGGLGGLREKIEKAGGQLKIVCDKGVCLHIRLPKQGEEG